MRAVAWWLFVLSKVSGLVLFTPIHGTIPNPAIFAIQSRFDGGFVTHDVVSTTGPFLHHFYNPI
jgi:hypothetical protein